jgi:hypothetical protein
MRRLSTAQAIRLIAVLVVIAALVLVLYDPVMNAIFIDREGLGNELAP